MYSDYPNRTRIDLDFVATYYRWKQNKILIETHVFLSTVGSSNFVETGAKYKGPLQKNLQTALV